MPASSLSRFLTLTAGDLDLLLESPIDLSFDLEILGERPRETDRLRGAGERERDAERRSGLGDMEMSDVVMVVKRIIDDDMVLLSG